MKDVFVGVVLGLFLVFANASAGVAAQQGGGGGSCTSSGATQDGEGNWTLDTCAGTCQGNRDCEKRSGNQGSWCGCFGGVPSNPCCNIGLDPSGNPTEFGNCPSCPLTGLCTLGCYPLEGGGQSCEAACRNRS